MSGRRQVQETGAQVTTQIPLLLSDDAKAIVSRVKHTYPSGRLEMSSLFTCWRPPGGRSEQRPWTDRRVYKAIEEAEAAGAICRREGITGTILEIALNDQAHDPRTV